MLQPVTRPLIRPLCQSITGALGGGFSPIGLFTGTDKGYIYDNNDLTSFYLDSAGVTPATVNGLVGLQLDKSGNLALGAESAVNGSFDTDTNWTKGTGITISGGTLNFTSGTTLNANANQVIGATNGKYVEVTIVVSAITAGILNVQLDSGVGASNSITTAGTYTYRLFQLPSFNTVYILAKAAGTTATVDSISVKAIPGNHRYQTTTGSKPILRGTPVGSSLVTNGDFATNVSGWTAAGGASVSWVGGKMRVTNSAGGGRGAGEQTITTVVGRVYRIRFSATAGTAPSAFFGAAQSTNGGSSIVGAFNSLGTDIYFTAVGTTTYIYAQPNTTTASQYIDIDDISVLDVTADAVTAPYGLQYDGIDDFLTTASVDFTATDKMAVVMGVRKLAQGVRQMLVEHNGGSLPGFSIEAPGASGTGYRVSSGGSGLSQAAITGYDDVTSRVTSAVCDIAGDSAILRVNGTAVSTAVADQGTGNYANAVLYFGRRGGASLPMNGLDFGGVCIGKTLTATQLASVEKWVSLRTGVTI